MKEIIAKLADFKDLNSSEVSDVLERIVTRRVTETQIAAFLLALKMKGETVEERTALAQAMRGHTPQIPTNEYQETINKAKSMTKIGEMQ